MLDSRFIDVILSGVLQSLINIIAALVLYFVLRLSINKYTKSTGRRMTERKANTIRTVLLSVLKYVLIFFLAGEILQTFGIKPQTVLAVAGVGSVAIGFGAQGLVKDFITGLFILMEDQYGVGDIITVENRTGTVEIIGLRTTHIRSLDGSLHIIPNSEIKIVTNISSSFNRAVVDIVIPYEEKIDEILAVLSSEMDIVFTQIKGLKDKPSVLGVTALTDRGANIRIMADCEPGEHWSVEREIRRLVMIKLDNEAIRFPYPRNIVIKGDDC